LRSKDDDDGTTTTDGNYQAGWKVNEERHRGQDVGSGGGKPRAVLITIIPTSGDFHMISVTRLRAYIRYTGQPFDTHNNNRWSFVADNRRPLVFIDITMVDTDQSRPERTHHRSAHTTEAHRAQLRDDTGHHPSALQKGFYIFVIKTTSYTPGSLNQTQQDDNEKRKVRRQ